MAERRVARDSQQSVARALWEKGDRAAQGVAVKPPARTPDVTSGPGLDAGEGRRTEAGGTDPGGADPGGADAGGTDVGGAKLAGRMRRRKAARRPRCPWRRRGGA